MKTRVYSLETETEAKALADLAEKNGSIDGNLYNQEVIEMALKIASKNQQWLAIKGLCSITGANAPSKEANGEALFDCFYHPETIRYLCALEESKQPSTEDVSNFLLKILNEIKTVGSTQYLWSIVKYLCELKTKNQPTREAMESAQAAAVEAKKWKLVQLLSSWEGENAPSKKANGKALLGCGYHPETIGYLCALEESKQPSTEDVSCLLKTLLELKILKSVTARTKIDQYPWPSIEYLCSLETKNKLNQEDINTVLLCATKSGHSELVKNLVLKSGDNAPDQATVNKALLSNQSLSLVQSLCDLTVSNPPDKQTKIEVFLRASRCNRLQVVEYLHKNQGFDQEDIDNAFIESIKLNQSCLAVIDYFCSGKYIDVQNTGRRLFANDNAPTKEHVISLLDAALKHEKLDVLEYFCELMQEKIIPQDYYMVVIDNVLDHQYREVLLHLGALYKILDENQISDIRFKKISDESSEEGAFSLCEMTNATTTAKQQTYSESYYQKAALFVKEFNAPPLKKTLFKQYHSPHAFKMVAEIESLLESPTNGNVIEIWNCIDEFIENLLAIREPVIQSNTMKLLEKYGLFSVDHYNKFQFLMGCSEYICESVEYMTVHERLACFISNYKKLRDHHSMSSFKLVETISDKNFDLVNLFGEITKYLDGKLRDSNKAVKSTTIQLLDKYRLLSEEHLEMFSLTDDTAMFVKKDEYFEANEPVSSNSCSLQ